MIFQPGGASIALLTDNKYLCRFSKNWHFYSFSLGKLTKKFFFPQFSLTKFPPHFFFFFSRFHSKNCPFLHENNSKFIDKLKSSFIYKFQSFFRFQFQISRLSGHFTRILFTFSIPKSRINTFDRYRQSIGRSDSASQLQLLWITRDLLKSESDFEAQFGKFPFLHDVQIKVRAVLLSNKSKGRRLLPATYALEKKWETSSRFGSIFIAVYIIESTFDMMRNLDRQYVGLRYERFIEKSRSRRFDCVSALHSSSEVNSLLLVNSHTSMLYFSFARS